MKSNKRNTAVPTGSQQTRTITENVGEALVESFRFHKAGILVNEGEETFLYVFEPPAPCDESALMDAMAAFYPPPSFVLGYIAITADGGGVIRINPYSSEEDVAAIQEELENVFQLPGYEAYSIVPEPEDEPVPLDKVMRFVM